ncbi:MAG: MBL fold metallo-hydrolase [Candidatus Gottesmanbacteria bacterium]|nr:MBL fold metallo-hydrolase [Candidatus Gottesmanbacteria bacterium]
MAANCYLVDDSIIDPGDDAEYILSHLKIPPSRIIATHGHFDHIMAAYALQLSFNIPFLMHKDDAFLVGKMQQSARHFLNITPDPPPNITAYIHDGDKIAGLTVLHTPGHTPGSISLYSQKNSVVFSGDTIFAEGAVGRTDHEYSNAAALSRSIKKILTYPSKTKLLSGHGAETIIRQELRFHRSYPIV